MRFKIVLTAWMYRIYCFDSIQSRFLIHFLELIIHVQGHRGAGAHLTLSIQYYYSTCICVLPLKLPSGAQRNTAKRIPVNYSCINVKKRVKNEFLRCLMRLYMCLFSLFRSHFFQLKAKSMCGKSNFFFSPTKQVSHSKFTLLSNERISPLFTPLTSSLW